MSDELAERIARRRRAIRLKERRRRQVRRRRLVLGSVLLLLFAGVGFVTLRHGGSGTGGSTLASAGNDITSTTLKVSGAQPDDSWTPHEGPVPILMYHVIGDPAAGVADDVGLPGAEAEQGVDVEPGVHARDDRETTRRLHRQGTGEVPGVPLVVGQTLVGHAHDVLQDDGRIARTIRTVRCCRGFRCCRVSVFPGCPEVHDGCLWPNDRPGLGIDIDERLAARYPYPDHPTNGAWPEIRTLDGTIVRP